MKGKWLPTDDGEPHSFGFSVKAVLSFGKGLVFRHFFRHHGFINRSGGFSGT